MLAYVVDDDESVNELESYILQQNGFETVSIYNAECYKKEMEKKLPDIVLLDIILPDNDGIALVSQMRKNNRTKNVPVILVSSKDKEIEKVKGLDAGADDYITKPFGNMEMMSRVKAVMRRSVNQKKSDNTILKAGEVTMDLEKRQVKVASREVILTFKEFELLKYLVINKGIVLSRDKIMENVWGFDFQGESRTVDMHIKTLRKKMKCESDFIQTIRNVGYKLNS